MKKIMECIIVLALIVSAAFANGNQEGKKAEDVGGKKDYKIVWYAPAVHPYFDSVKKGVEGFEADTGITVFKQIGPDWNQASETQGLEALAAKGYKGFSVYPTNASGANSIYKELTANGMVVVNFGADTEKPTTASFAVATDVKDAAKVATTNLIKLMGGKGNILNVLEVLTDPNTKLRKEGVDEVVAATPGVKIIQEVADIQSIEQATEKIQNAIAAQKDKIDGIVCTGYTTTVATAQILSEFNKTAAKKIRFVGIDDDPVVLKAIKDGSIDASIAQNPYGHGYLSCMLLKYLQDGWTPKPGVYFINAGVDLITKENVDNYSSGMEKVTKEILANIETMYLNPPKK